MSTGQEGKGVEAASLQHSLMECAVLVKYIPKYTPGSGPAMAPISILPLDDKDGIIFEEYVDQERGPRFMVTYEDNPALRVGVDAENILDWVSARTYEEWTTEQMRLKGIGDDEKGKQNKNIKRKHSPVPKMDSSTATEARKGRPSKKAKKVEEEPVSVSLQAASSPSKQRGLAAMPSEDDDELALDDTPTQIAIDRQFQMDDAGLSDDDDEDEDSFEEPTFMALNRQLKGTPGPSKLRYQELRSNTTSPIGPKSDLAPASELETEEETGSENDVKSSKSKKRTASELRQREMRSSSRQTNSSSTSSRQSRRQRTSSPPLKHSIAVTSSLEANRQLEELERGAKAKTGDETSSKTASIHERYSKIGKPKISAPERSKTIKAKEVTQYFAGSLKPRLPKTPPKKSKKASKTPEPEPLMPDANDDVWEVEAILEDRNAIDSKGNIVVDNYGNEVMEYHIKWAGGEWDPTWEPEENVSVEMIEEYAQKRAKATQPRMRMANDREVSVVEKEYKTMTTQGAGKGNNNGRRGKGKAEARDEKAKAVQPQPQYQSSTSAEDDDDDDDDDSE